MDWLIILGAVISVAGLVGLVVCILKALRVKRAGGTEEEMRARLAPLVPLNLGSMSLSVIGLMCVVVGILLQN